MTRPATTAPAKARPRLRLVPKFSREPSIPAVVAVAAGDEEDALAVFPDLVARRISPCMVAGIDRSVDPVTSVIERSETPTLFVVCVTENVSADAVAAVVEAFGRERRPFHRLVVLELADSEQFLSEVEKAGRALLEPVELPTFPELDGFLTGSAEASTARGEREDAPEPDGNLMSEGPSVRVDGNTAAASVRMRQWSSGSRPVLSVLEGGAAGHDVDTKPIVPIDAPLTETGAVTSRFGRTAQGAAALAFAAGVTIVPLLVPDGSGPRVTTTPALPAAAMVDALPTPPHRPLPNPAAEGGPEPAPLDPMQVALRQGEVIDADAWWLKLVREDEVSWGAAAGRCRRARVDDQGGFQLPTRPQLWALIRASALPRGRYWTRSLARGTDAPSNWVFDSDVGHMVAVDKNDTARSICLRTK